MIKILTLIALTISLYGCPSYEFPVSATLETPSYSIYAYPAFACTIDDVGQICRDGENWYYCNSADNLTYVFNSGALALSSVTQLPVSCTADIFQHADTIEDDRPVTPQPQ